MRKKEKSRSARHEKSLKRKIGFKLPLIGILLVLMVCMVLFVSHQRNPVQTESTKRVETSSVKKKESERKSVSDKKPQKASSINESSNIQSNASGVIAASPQSEDNKPNAGKVLKYDSVAAAESAIKQHEASCPYGHEPFYPGLVYTGTYQCNCGLKIIWWDKAAKESVNEDVRRFSEEGIVDSEYNYDTNDPWPDIPTENVPSSETESSNVDEYNE